MIDLRGFFEDWDFEKRVIRAKRLEDRYCLWVYSGFMFFDDYREHDSETPLLSKAGLWLRWRLWLEYKRECRRRIAASAGSRRACRERIRNWKHQVVTEALSNT